MKTKLYLFILVTFIGCAGQKNHNRYPSSFVSNNPCMQSVEAFFSNVARDQAAHMSESGLIEKGLVKAGELDSLKNDPVYKKIFLSEDESLRDESAKVVALIRRYRADLNPSQVADFYHSLFHSCRL